MMNIINSAAKLLFNEDNLGFLYACVIFLIITIKIISSNKNMIKIIFDFVKKPKAIIGFSIIIIWCLLVYKYSKLKDEPKENIKRVITATKKAILALVIAFFARIDLVVAPFWLVWIITYYLEGWI